MGETLFTVYFCFFCTVTDFSAAEKDRGAWNFACVLAYYPDRSSPIWRSKVKGQDHQGQKNALSAANGRPQLGPYTLTPQCAEAAHRRTVVVGRWGIRNWGWRRCLRPCGGICVLQACWRTCFVLVLCVLVFCVYWYFWVIAILCRQSSAIDCLRRRSP